MNKKSEKKKKEKEDKKKKNLTLIIAAVVAIVILVVVTVILANFKSDIPEEINDDYFVSDGNKIVLSLDDEMASFINGEFEPSITHIVYYCNGNKIYNKKYFFVYSDEGEANVAYEEIGDNYKEWASSKELNGKYIIFQDNSESYERLSTERVKDDIERMKAVGGAL